MGSAKNCTNRAQVLKRAAPKHCGPALQMDRPNGGTLYQPGGHNGQAGVAEFIRPDV